MGEIRRSLFGTIARLPGNHINLRAFVPALGNKNNEIYGDLFYGNQGLFWPAIFIWCVCIPTKAYNMEIVMFSVITSVIFTYS